jgi:hypothetical protein
MLPKTLLEEVEKMSLRTMERLLIAGSLLLGVTVVGCGDDDDPPSEAGMDAGDPPEDAGTDARTDARVDSGSDADTGGPGITCGSNTCTGTVIANNTVRPCCVEETSCGLEAEDIKKASPSSPFTGCVPKDVAAASDSEYCGAFFDQIEPEGDHENGGLDIKSGNRYAVFEGCCLSTGECGANITVPRGAAVELNSHLGCVSFARLRDAFNEQSGDEEAPVPDHLPFCNPENGEPPTMGTVPDVGKFVCGCGEGNLYVEGEGGLPCLNNLPPEVCGDADPTDEELAKIPEFICGCTANSKLPCLRNLDAATCGTKAIDATSAELAAIPEFICGCTADSKLPCMLNVESTVCGGKAITADSAELNDLPVFICGAVGLTTPSALPTMPNVEASICGKKAITADSAELDAVPQFICGRTNNPQAAVLPTMANVDVAICGKKVMTADSAELTGVPVFICGAVNNPDTSTLPKLRNVDVAICGKKVMTADSAELNGVPVFICGAVNNPDTSTLPKLRNVDVAICGKAAVANGSPFLTAVPEFMCGCTGRIDPKLGCLPNLAASVCGGAAIASDSAVLAAVPRFVCGCGPSALDTGFGRLCMGNVETTTCGTRDATVNDRGTPGSAADDCLVGVPEYARGCGDSEPPVGSSCLRRTPQLFGCDNVTAGPVLRLPEYLCGCGEAKPVGAGTADASLPCLPFVLETFCGAIPISASQQVAPIPNIVCGCGDGVTTTAAPCLDNVPPSVCGSQAMCVLNQSGAAAGCDDGEVCVDVQGGAGAGAGGAGGAGDGIADNCVNP